MPLFSKRPETDGLRRRLGPIEWLRNYGYYYKGVFTVGIIAAVIVLAALFLLHYDGADMRLYFITAADVSDEDYYGLVEKMNGYVYDVDGDNVKSLRQQRLHMAANPQTEAEKKVYADIDAAIADDETIFFVVDDAGYDYVRERCGLRPLAYFGIVSDDEYRLPLNGAPLTEGTGLAEGPPIYLIMKLLDDSKYNDYYVSGRTDVVVGMARNNDQSEENDVTIAK